MDIKELIVILAEQIEEGMDYKSASRFIQETLINDMETWPEEDILQHAKDMGVEYE